MLSSLTYFRFYLDVAFVTSGSVKSSKLSLAAVTQGISTAWPTPVLAKFHDNLTDIRITDDQMAWAVAMSSPGFLTGGILNRYTSDLCGRRNSLLISNAPVIMGTIVAIFAKVPWLIYIARYLWGINVGFVTTVTIRHIAEIADKEIRGGLSLVNRFMFNFGSLLIMAIGSFVSYNTINYMMLVLPITYFITCYFIPESPYYYLKNEKVQKARKSLALLRKYEDPKDLEEELIQLQADVRKDMRRSGTAKELFTRKAYRKAIIVAAGLKIAQLMTGSLIIQQYLGRIMQESKTHMELSTVFIAFGTVRFLVSIMSSVLVDRVGRCPLLIYSFLGTSISLFVVGGYFFLSDVIVLEPDTLRPFCYVPFIGIIATNVISTLGYNSIISIIPGEIFPMNIKAVALSYLSIFSGALNFFISLGYQVIKDHLGLCGVFWLFTLVAVAGTVFSAAVVPETKGKSLSEIQKMLQGKELNDEVEERLNSEDYETDKVKSTK